MADRSLWFEAHLFADRSGRRARAACERLGSAAHEVILATGDRLASASPTVAQQFYRHAAGIWNAFGQQGLEQWVRLGEELLQLEQGHREAGLAYFSTSPEVVERAGLPRLQEWCAAARRISEVSRKLAACFLEGTASLIDRVDDELLQEWARQGIRLHTTQGWHGEFLARAFFASAGETLRTLSLNDIEPWTDLAIALQANVRERQFFTKPPAGFSSFKAEERKLFLATALRLAHSLRPAALTFYTELPGALRRVSSPTRLKLLQVFHQAEGADPTEVAAVVPVIGALIRDIRRPHRRVALGLALQVAQRFPRGAVRLLRSLPIVLDGAAPEAVHPWVRQGIEIAAQNGDAGLAYFDLESRTSLRILHASSTAATIGDVQGMLRQYVQMLSARPASIRSFDLFRLRLPLEEFPLENEIALPAKIDLFVTHEDNCRLYRVLAAHVAGRREFGTYEPNLPDGESLLQHLRGAHGGSAFEELFLVTDGFRIAAALARDYPGLAQEQKELAERFLDRQVATTVPSQTELFDSVSAWLLCGRPVAALPVWVRVLASLVGPAVAPLARAGATVDEALAVARLLAQQLEPGESAQPDTPLDELAFERLTGEALFDQYADDELDLSPGDGPELPGDSPVPPVEAQDVSMELEPEVEEPGGAAAPLSPEEIQQLIESGADLRLKQGYGNDVEGLGLYISDLIGKVPQPLLDELRQQLEEAPRSDRPPMRRSLERRGEGASFYYDEWDYQIRDYRERWCRLLEMAVEGDSGEFFNRTLLEYSELIPEVRRQFQRIRPEMYRTVRGLEDGEDFDLNAVVNARVDRRARRPPSPKLYVARAREERDVATLFLIDMSASTDEPFEKTLSDGPLTGPLQSALKDLGGPTAKKQQRIIDVTKEALVIMAEALEEIGDAYAVYGFSGHGRANVEFYLVKSFNEILSSAVKGRIGALEPKRSTRMGTALRHAVEKLAAVSSRSRHIILLSDGFPQDFDYGQDRRSNLYGLRDTAAALREAEAAGITPFCITVDKAGHDYLREMCDESRYLVIEDITALPRELPKIYQRVVTT
jgi:hypothetical protein